PTNLAVPRGTKFVGVETAHEMLAACEQALPVDVAVCAAAVADWRVDHAANQKIKKAAGALPTLNLIENPDILRSLSSRSTSRPRLVIGFAAETEKVIEHAAAKRLKKGCDWIVANDVSPTSGVMGGDENTVHVISAANTDTWPKLAKTEVAIRLARKIAAHFQGAPA
ncbi:MAG: bifunctional phosphopantothenoylcysteine decarboxylase/phosphopantothenate synthase, partial [Alphaproteobacteria bacterium]|nr:bifunctional phosphopantothenoylcysteine decarboxylase/phosphopantothenate synthase [Alphaproteobacteria bacterium]